MKAETAGQLSARKLRPLPPGWRWVRLGEICQVNPSRSPNFQRPADAPTTFVPMEAVDEEQGAITRPQTKPYHEVMKGYTYFEEGDIIWAKITPCMENGKSAVARGLRDSFAFGSTEFHVIRPTSIVIPEFIWHFVRQPSFRLEATRHFVGAVGQQRVPEVFLKNALLPLPPLTEQRAIIARLEAQMAQVQRLRAAAERQLEAARAMQGAILRQVFRYKEGEPLPPGWRWVRLGEVADVVNGVGFPEHQQGRKSLPYLFVKVSDMNAPGAERTIFATANTVDGSLLRQLGGRVYPAGTVLFPKVGGALLTNKRRILGKPGCFDNNVMGLVPKGIEGIYLFYWFSSVNLRSLSNIQALPSVRQSSIAELLLPVPPPEDQRAIVARLEVQMAQVQRLRAAAERQLEAIHALPGALLNEVFGGFEPPAGSEPAGGYGR